MGKNPGDPFVIPIMVALVIVSIPLGLFFWAALLIPGLAAIQAGLHGFRSTGYESIGGSRLTGKPARILGGVVIAIGIVWEIVVIVILTLAISGFRLG